MNIITITVNPALDKSAKVDGLVAEQKLKCHSISFQAGGGGINISRVLTRLKIESDCVFTSGGDNGKYLQHMLLQEKVKISPIPIQEWTRENLSIVDTLSSNQYRFGMPGKPMSKLEIDLITNTILNKVNKNDILALSGSLAPNMPDDYYAQIIKKVADKDVKVILDTSGPALQNTLKQPLFLIKPNQKELALLAGEEFLTTKEQEAFAMQLVNIRKVKYVVVSMGSRGAFLASKEGIVYQSTPSIPVKSTIGAGDSMVAGLIYGIRQDYSPQDMLKFGVACGVATTMSEGTNLASAETINHVLELLN